MKTPKTISAAIARRPEVVREVWRESDCAYPWWVSFNPGFTYDNDGQHAYSGFAADVARYIRRARRCECQECKTK